MGRKNKGASSNKKAKADLSDLMSELFSPMPPNKRGELNKLVEKLLEKCSNFASEPLTPSKLMDEHKEIRVMVDKIRGLESTNMNRKLRGPRIRHVPQLLEWLKSNGAEIHGVTLKEVDDLELGLFVSEGTSLKEGDVVIKIPRKCIMSSETARDSSIGSLIEKDPMLKTMHNVALTLHLLIEKNSPASFWGTLYQRSPTYVDALKQYKFVARQYAYFYRKFQNTMLRDYFTYDEYRWAVSTVTTRQNKVPCTKPDSYGLSIMANALIPFWDMANHSVKPPVLSTDFDIDSDSLLCLANQNFKAGQEFTIFYGVRGNMDFLIHNGFIPLNNEYNFYSLKIGFGKNDPLFALKNSLLEKIPDSSSQGSYALKKNSPMIEELLLSFLRINSMNESELNEYLKKDDASWKSLTLETKTPFDDKAYNYLKNTL
ncbi:SETD3 [Lepeophtheirus salmonis]|uniref:protein-histidine N-methyltransferase n=1 Tax=Lepeophtheirus salmonis TaxID=72036 RepID=A0A7R8D326_LEPSM|nr:SETD3 [Lepeophtheirus salmonis]CAF2981079.1 SETD3 [Lepeophtheirus salmonis]